MLETSISPFPTMFPLLLKDNVIHINHAYIVACKFIQYLPKSIIIFVVGRDSNRKTLTKIKFCKNKRREKKKTEKLYFYLFVDSLALKTFHNIYKRFKQNMK